METFDTSQTTLKATFSDTSWLEDANTDLTNDLQHIYNNYNNLQIPSTDP